MLFNMILKILKGFSMIGGALGKLGEAWGSFKMESYGISNSFFIFRFIFVQLFFEYFLVLGLATNGPSSLSFFMTKKRQPGIDEP